MCTAEQQCIVNRLCSFLIYDFGHTQEACCAISFYSLYLRLTTLNEKPFRSLGIPFKASFVV
jgi:hypothetical protein